jgi:flagellin
MPAVLNTNVASLWASKNLLGAQSKMADSVERLSSGLRINRAKDDAAGLGVANALTSQINSANQGIRNLNDGISMVQTAEAAITAASDMGQRILTLATQGANAPLGIDERKAIQAEMSKLLDAMDSIGRRTKFSGNDLLGVVLDDTAATTKYSLQISRETDDKVNLTNAAFRNIGYTSSAVDEKAVYQLSGALTAGQTIVIAGRTVTAGAGGASLADVFTAFASGDTTAVTTGAANATATPSGTLTTGWTVTSSTSAKTITLTSTTTSQNVSDLTANTGTATATLTVTQGSTTRNAQGGTLKTKVDDLNTLLNPASGSPDVSLIAAKFNEIQTAAKEYVVALGTQRSLLGAFQNQIEYTISNVTDLSGNLNAARSRVQDTDYASETANLTKGQILQQAATAMLAQANQMPNVILTLLK